MRIRYNTKMDTLSRFADRLEFPDSGCWLWTRGVSRAGYGLFHVDGESYAHRWSFKAFNGTIPDGLEIDHTCRVRHCVNPDHLEAVSHAVNVARGMAGSAQRARMECPRGHAYTPENTYRLKGGKRGDSPIYTRRTCLTCKREKAIITLEKARERTRTEGREYRGTATHCKYGHALSGANLRVAPSGYAVCRECLNRRQREYHARKASAA